MASNAMTLRKLAREPLVHFLALGALLFAIGAIAGNDAGRSAEIVVTPGEVESLIEGFRRTWQRPPTETELRGLVEERIKEEVYFREAQAMGLDQDDAIIRRRMRQKLEFLTKDLAMQAEPTREELQRYLDEHPEKFRRDSRVSFGQIYLSIDRRGPAGARAEAERLLEQLERRGGSADPSQLGDPLMLGYEFESISDREVARLFGREFAAALAETEIDAWAGPVESSYGLHLVFAHEREPGRVPTLDEVAEAVRREVLAERSDQANEEIYARMRERYAVTIEWPEWTGLDSVDAASR